jgi:hypothetical protein
VPRVAWPYAPHMRDIEVIDYELRLLRAFRRTVSEAEGRPPSTAARIDELLDKRAATMVLNATAGAASARCLG